MRNRLRLETALPLIAAFVAAGCKSRGPAPPELRPTETQTCLGFNDALLAGVTLAPGRAPADYLELREQLGGGLPTIIGKRGVPCASASDKPTCETALRTIRASRGFAQRGSGDHMTGQMFETYLVATSGDRVEVVTTREELGRLLAPIDNKNDLELIAGCGRMMKTSLGWEVTAVSTDAGECWGGTSGWQRFAVSQAGVVTTSESHLVNRPPTCIGGRRPEGLVAHEPRGDAGSLAEFFAASAHLEAASVVAFERLADELTTLGAPTELIARARQSGEDEARHAQMMETLLRREGGTPRAPVVRPLAARSTFALAHENAVEGCVRETFGALLAHYQANAAGREDVRDAMRSIAIDETAHAALAWDVANWLEPRLSAAEQADLARARAWALQELALSLDPGPGIELARTAGLPGAGEARELLAALVSTLAPACHSAAVLVS